MQGGKCMLWPLWLGGPEQFRWCSSSSFASGQPQAWDWGPQAGQGRAYEPVLQAWR